MSENKKSVYVPIKVLAVYSVIFYPLWTVFHFFIDPVLQTLPSEALSAFISEGIIKNLIWTLPAVILMRKYSDKLHIPFKDMFKWNKDCNKYLLVFPAFLSYVIFGIVVHGGKLALSGDFGLDEIITVLFVGVTEEFVFRGWLLNATVNRKENVAVGLNALMFLAIHFPRWIAEGAFITNFKSLGFISILALSYIFGWIFIKTKNIVLPITLHMFWDLIIFMLY